MIRSRLGARAIPILRQPILYRYNNHHYQQPPRFNSGSNSTLRFIPLFFSYPPLLLLESQPTAVEDDDDDDEEGSIPIITRKNEFLIPANSPHHLLKPKGRVNRFLSLLNYYFLEPLKTARRFVHLAILFLPVILTSPILLLQTGDEESPSTKWWYKFLVDQMQRAGPTFIKLAQWAGSRTDLFPTTLCDLFGKLHSNGKPHPLSHTKKALQKAFGLPFEEIFETFEEKPMGIGAIAQVYKAVINPSLLHSPNPQLENDPTISITRSGGVEGEVVGPKKPEVVAIKILHPKVSNTIARDLKIMAFFASVLDSLPTLSWLSIPEEVQVFGALMVSQLDLRIEAGNLDKFNENFKKRNGIEFPKAKKEFTGIQVLTEEFEDALPLELFLKNGAGPFDTRIANRGLDAFLNMLLIDNYCHADLHPGNIMIKFVRTPNSTRSILHSFWYETILGRPPAPIPHDPISDAKNLEIIHNLRSISKHTSPKPPEPQNGEEPITTPWLSALEELSSTSYEPTLVFIDAGLTTELSPRHLQDFLDLFSSVASFDGYRSGQLMIERSKSPDSVIDEEMFKLKMQKLMLGVRDQSFSLGKIKIGDLLGEVLGLVRKHHVRMEADFVGTVISILLLEGIGRQLDPDMDLFKSALPIIRQLGGQMRPKDFVDSKFDIKGLGGIFKIWVWIEARQLAELATADVDDLIRYDRFTPNV